MAVQTQIQWRRGTAASWTSTNPTLAAGEVGLETDTGKFKVGTGSSTWTALAYGTVLPATLTAKGSILAASAASTPAELAVGNNGETLVADSSTSTGLRYQAPVNANPVLNSAFQVWQRGTSFSVAGGVSNSYTSDRWAVNCTANAASTISRQTTSDTTNLPFIQYCTRVQRNSGQTGTTGQFLYQSLETVNSLPYAGKTVTYSFYARAGATYISSGASSTFKLWSGTGTDQNILTGFTNTTQVAAVTPTLTTTWQRFTCTGTMGATATQLAVGVDMGAVGTAGATDYIEVTGFQIEVGSVATPFKTYAATIQGELAADERYYERLLATSTAGVYAVGFASSATACDFFVKFSTDKRVAISAIDFANINASDLVNTPPTVTNITIVMSGVSGAWIRVSAASGFVQYRPYFLLNNNNAAGYIGFSAEL